MVTNEKVAVAGTPEKKSATLERAKFEDGTHLVLFIRITREPKRWGGDPFRLRWSQGPGSGKKGTTQGVAKTCPDESSAREAFKAAVRSAITQGWKQVPIGAGHAFELRPSPAPKKRVASNAMAALEHCRSCRRPVRLLLTAKGHRMPIDPDPAGRSTGLERTSYGSLAPSLVIREGRVHVLRPLEPWDGELYVSHFATCPEARRWQRKILKKAAERAHERVWEGLDEERARGRR